MDWWKDYFARVWEPMSHLIKQKRDTVHECDLLDHLMHEFEMQTLLDVPCGSGRIALEMARRGYEVTGVDFNSQAIQKAKQKAQRMTKNRPSFVQDDMRNMQLDRKFNMAACLYNSFGYFSETENLAFLKSVSNLLTDGGCLLLETHVLETLLPVFTPKEYWRYDEYILLEERVFDFNDSRLKGNWTLIDKSGNRENFSSSVRIYPYHQLIHLLTTCGFTHFEPFGSYHAEPFEMGADMLLLLARKGDIEE